ncbi:hypothetical protein Hte_008696 [Hypoxylon texense]
MAPVEDDVESTRLIKQPETRPISQEQLIAEVKGIYAGLVMVESKCIEVDNAQSSQNDTQLNNEQWQALIALHRTLLHEHHDFFLASQHPSASQALRRLASKMAIEDDDIRDREVWTSVSRHWYSKASDKAPTTGRLYHHLAILARPNPLQQLYYYTKSLCVPIPFSSARESIMTLFDPILDPNGALNSRLIPIDVFFVKAHGILFSNKFSEEFDSVVESFRNKLGDHIGRTTRKWMESGYHIGISNCCALLCYGQDDSAILKAIRPQHGEDTTEPSTDIGKAVSEYKPNRTEEGALKLFEGTCDIVLRRLGDPNLNALLLSYREHHRIEDEQFPRQEKELAPRPLPEDFAMKGLLWVEKYFPLDWFSNDKIDDDEKYFEVASMTDHRKERILWLGCRIAKSRKWLTYDGTSHQFGVVPDYEKNIDSAGEDAEMVNSSEATEPASRTSTFDPSTSVGNASDGDEDMMDVDEAFARKPIIRQR